MYGSDRIQRLLTMGLSGLKVLNYSEGDDN